VQDWQYGNKSFLAKLSTISQLMLLAPSQAEEKATEITEICIQEILLKNRNPVTEDNNVDWVSDEDLDDECWAKMLALKTLVNRLRAHPNMRKLQEFAAPIFRLLNSLISNEGEISKAKNTPKSHQSRLRLCAANCFLKLSLITSYDNIISPIDFNRLALVAQDERQAVRRGFVRKLKKHLMTGKLSSRFYGILFLMAYEPKADLKDDTFRWLTARARLERSIPNNNNVLEQVFAKFISLLAHHPDFDTKLEDLSDFAKYFVFYLQTIATEENISLIYHIAQRVKQYRDALNPSSEVNPFMVDRVSVLT
jgi:sister chromatid cohesion protein PDS5